MVTRDGGGKGMFLLCKYKNGSLFVLYMRNKNSRVAITITDWIEFE
jgi:hypothetical protein